ncbi:MAG: energy transducer TonB [Deltaproteobacteria bacterium]|nr:energy transducer TonB [Deltaproteobacteria bacterium]
MFDSIAGHPRIARPGRWPAIAFVLTAHALLCAAVLQVQWSPPTGPDRYVEFRVFGGVNRGRSASTTAPTLDPDRTSSCSFGCPRLMLRAPVDTPARPTDLCAPVERVVGVHGRVLVRYTVDAKGRARLLHVLNPDAPASLVESVRDYLEGCPFEPATVGLRAVSSTVTQIFRFEPPR